MYFFSCCLVALLPNGNWQEDDEEEEHEYDDDDDEETKAKQHPRRRSRGQMAEGKESKSIHVNCKMMIEIEGNTTISPKQILNTIMKKYQKF